MHGYGVVATLCGALLNAWVGSNVFFFFYVSKFWQFLKISQNYTPKKNIYIYIYIIPNLFFFNWRNSTRKGKHSLISEVR
jgi:hypothetical protein